MRVFLNANLSRSVRDNATEAIIAERALKMSQCVKRWLRLKMTSDARTRMQRRFVLVVEEVNIGAIDGHRGKHKQRADEPLRLLLVRNPDPFSGVAGWLRRLSTTVIAKFSEPNLLPSSLGIAATDE